MMTQTDTSLIFGIVAYQNEYITLEQFAAVCRAWGSGDPRPMPELLVERGWIDEQAREEVERLVERKLRRHKGDLDLRVTLGGVAGGFAGRLRQVSGPPELCSEGSPPDFRAVGALPAEQAWPALEATLPPPAQAAGRYQLCHILGEGGLGRVWAARDAVLNRTVALKELRPEHAHLERPAREFLKEAQITGQLEHPNIVPIYDLGRYPGTDHPIYAMRLVHGETLRNAIAAYHRERLEGRRDRLRLAQLLNAFVGICNALGFAHSRDVIHRDLKPENVILGPFGEVLVLDWGLAKLVDGLADEAGSAPPEGSVEVTGEATTERTLAGSIRGTPAYMSPEQAEGRAAEIGPRTDIYGLGAILFEILTGAPPHQGRSVGEVVAGIVARDTPRARSVQPRVPRALDAICAKAMTKSPAGRYERASDLAEDVQRWLADEPVTAHRENVAQRLARWARRHRTWTQAAAAALVVVTAVSLTAAHIVDRSRREALHAKEEATRRFQQAREAADTLLTGVSRDLERVPGAKAVRIRLLEKAADFYERFARERSNDSKLRLESGYALVRLGEVRRILDSLGDRDLGGAEAACRQAEDIFARLALEQPDDPEPRFGRCTALIGRGLTCQTLDRVREATPAFEAAIEGLEALHAERPSEPRYRDRLAFALASLGNALEASGKPGEAASSYRRALATYDGLVLLAPGEASYRSDRARARANLGLLLYNAGRDRDVAGAAGDARKAYAEARDEYDRAIADLGGLDAGVPEYRERLARCRINLGVVDQALGQLERAEAAQRQAIREYESLIYRTAPDYASGLIDARINLAHLLQRADDLDQAEDTLGKAAEEGQKLVDAHPSILTYRRELGATLNNLGMLLAERDRPEDGLRAQDRAVEVRRALVKDHPELPAFRRELGNTLSQRCMTLRKLGRANAVAADAEELSALLPDDPTDRFNVACHLAWAAGKLGSGAARLRARAVEHLERALSRDPSLVSKLDDEDLSSLRDDARFRALRAPRPKTPR